MKTVVTLPNIVAPSWSTDLTASQSARQQFMYIQCLGHYHATGEYAITDRENLHSHLLLYTIKGMGLLEYLGHTIPLPPGSLALIDCEQLHSYRNAGDGTWEFKWIHFSGNCIDGYLNEIMKYWNIIELDHADKLMEQFLSYSDYSKQDNDLYCSTAIINLCSEYLLALKRSMGNTDASLFPLVKNAVDYLQEYFSAEISLDSMCENLHVSKSYLGHLFKQQLGASPYEYLINTRLSFAKSMLRGGNRSISEIAEASGFSSSSYFIQTFRKHEMMTPLQYRKYFLQLADNSVPYEV